MGAVVDAIESGGWTDPATELDRRLSSGEKLGPAAEAMGLDRLHLFGALAVSGLLDDGPGLKQAKPRRPWLRDAFSDETLATYWPKTPRPERLALAAGLWQIHDFWDLSHEAAQEADDLGERRTSLYWHGIAHRREPDPGNASYWFRRVGRHEVFPDLAESAASWVLETGPSWGSRVLKNGTWDPFAFVEVCTQARSGSPDEALARRIQAREMALLLDASLDQC